MNSMRNNYGPVEQSDEQPTMTRMPSAVSRAASAVPDVPAIYRAPSAPSAAVPDVPAIYRAPSAPSVAVPDVTRTPSEIAFGEYMKAMRNNYGPVEQSDEPLTMSRMASVASAVTNGQIDGMARAPSISFDEYMDMMRDIYLGLNKQIDELPRTDSAVPTVATVPGVMVQIEGQFFGHFTGQLNGQFVGQFDGKFYGQIDPDNFGEFNGPLDGQYDGQFMGEFYGYLNGQASGQFDGRFF
jgi:hypothetical protein